MLGASQCFAVVTAGAEKCEDLGNFHSYHPSPVAVPSPSSAERFLFFFLIPCPFFVAG